MSVHGKGQVFKLSNLAASLVDISAYLEKVEYNGKTDFPETSALGQLAERRQVIGKRSATISADGFWQASSSAKVHGKSTAVIFGGYALTGYITKGNVDRSIDLPEDSTLGDDWEEHSTLGRQKGAFSVDGFFDSTATSGIDARFRAMSATATPTPVSVAYNGFAIGNLVDLFQVNQGTIKVGGDKNNMVPISGSFMPDGLMDAGVSLHALTAETDLVNSTSVDQSAATAAGAVAQLHVTALTGTNCTIRVEHSTDDVTYAALITFTTVTGVTTERKGTGSDPEVADTTAVNRYVRSAISAKTALTSVTYVVTFARRAYTNATLAPGGLHLCLAELFRISTPPTFEVGPEGSASGARKLSGSCRVQSYKVTFDKSGMVKQSLSIVNHSTVTEGVY